MFKIVRLKERTLSFDFVFKSLFGDPSNIGFLTALLSSFLNIPYKELDGRVTLKNVEQPKKNEKVPGNRMDILVKLESGEVINVEMNGYSTTIERNVSYLCNLYNREQGSSKESYKTPKCIQINFNLYKDKPCNQDQPIEEYMIRNKDGKTLVDNFLIYQVDVEKCKSVWYNEVIKGNHNKEQFDKERWGMLMGLERIDILKDELQDMEMPKDVKDKVCEKIDELNADERLDYLWDYEHDEAQLKAALQQQAKEDGYKEGRKEGLEQGRNEGLEQGRNEGLEQGRSEGIEQGIEKGKLIVANNLKSIGMNLDEISSITGLSLEELESI